MPNTGGLHRRGYIVLISQPSELDAGGQPHDSGDVLAFMDQCAGSAGLACAAHADRSCMRRTVDLCLQTTPANPRHLGQLRTCSLSTKLASAHVAPVSPPAPQTCV